MDYALIFFSWSHKHFKSTTLYINDLHYWLNFVLPGSGLLASSEVGRNVIAVEKDQWQFLHSQMRVVSCLSCSAPADSSIVDVITEIPEG